MKNQVLFYFDLFTFDTNNLVLIQYLLVLGEYVAHFKFTVLLMPNGPHKITGLPFETDLYQSEHSITDPELKTLLNTSANPKSAKKKKKKSESTGEQPMEVEAAA